MNTANNGSPDRDDPGSHKKVAAQRVHPEHESLSGTSKTSPENDIPEENREERRHHQEYGNRKYKMFSNHSSADDQPHTNTGPTP